MISKRDRCLLFVEKPPYTVYGLPEYISLYGFRGGIQQYMYICTNILYAMYIYIYLYKFIFIFAYIHTTSRSANA